MEGGGASEDLGAWERKANPKLRASPGFLQRFWVPSSSPLPSPTPPLRPSAERVPASRSLQRREEAGFSLRGT